MNFTEEDIKAALRGMEDLSVEMHDWQVRCGEDWTGDPAVKVWAVLEDEDFERADYHRIRESVVSTIRALWIEDAPEIDTYFRIRSEEEEAEVEP